MIVNSITFLIFFSIVFILYYAGQKVLKWQQYILLFANFVFYAWADWKMLFLLIISIIVFYILGLLIEQYNSKNLKNSICAIGVIAGVGLLIYFKYLNFFISSFTTLLSKIGLECNHNTLKVVMPLGISFFTFKLISYIVDVRKNEMPACKNIVTLANYISFFPTIP